MSCFADTEASLFSPQVLCAASGTAVLPLLLETFPLLLPWMTPSPGFSPSSLPVLPQPPSPAPLSLPVPFVYVVLAFPAPEPAWSIISSASNFQSQGPLVNVASAGGRITRIFPLPEASSSSERLFVCFLLHTHTHTHTHDFSTDLEIFTF